MHPWLILQVLVLLGLANGMPVIINKLLGSRFSYRVDGEIVFIDGQPLLGASKTVRGILFSVLVTGAGAFLLRLHWKAGILMAGVSMTGDLFSSFVKRRMRFAPSSRATGLDQIPESLLPLLACRRVLSLTTFDISSVVALFSSVRYFYRSSSTKSTFVSALTEQIPCSYAGDVG